MTLSRMWRRSSRDEGASLLIVLIVVAFLGVILSAVTGFGATAENITTSLGGQAQATYTAGSGLDTAIRQISANVTEGYNTAGSSCPTLTLPGDSNGVNSVAATVTCAPTSDSQPSPPGGGGVNNNNRPKEAIRTLPSAALGDDGFRQASNNDLKVHGDMWVGGNIRIPVSNASLTVTGDVQAKGTCDAGLTASGTATCNNGVTYPPDPQQDPDTTYANTWVMPTVDPAATPQAVPSGCSPVTKTATLAPGRYTDVTALNNLVASGSCNGGIIYFSPGNYYFDFGTSSTGTAWNIANPNVAIVGGLVNSWSVGQPVSAYDPTAGCASSDTAPITGSGVAWVFAGASRLDVSNDGSIRLCAEPQTSQQEIVIWGVKTSTGSPAQTTSQDSDPTSASSPGVAPNTAFSSPTNVEAADGATSNVTLNSTSSTSGQASITASGFFGTDTIPSNATINTVQVVVKHTVTGGGAQDLKLCTLSVAGSSTGSLGCNNSNGAGASGGSDSFSLPTAGFATKTLRQAASVSFAVNLGSPNGRNSTATITDKVDEIKLSVNYTIPAVLGLTGEAGTCVQTTNTCPLIGTSGGADNVYFDGTTYAPLAFLSIQLTTERSEAFARGVVARTITANITASSSFTGSVFDLPDLTSGPPGPGTRKVVLTVMIAGSAVGTALVQFDSPAVGDVKILSWNIKHCGKSGC